MTFMPGESISRRALIKGGVQGGLLATGALGVGGGLIGCGSSSNNNSASSGGSPATGRIKRGGTLIVGSLGSAQDTADSQHGSTDADAQLSIQIYDTLTYFAHRGQKLQNGLAEEFEMSKGGRVATIRLRQGVTFHNGKPLTADDLVFSLQRIKDPKNPGHADKALASIDGNRIKKLDDRTVRLDLAFADAVLPWRFFDVHAVVVPVGFDPKNPVGTGPFKLKTFNAGQRYELVANKDYWIEGQPYLDAVTIIVFPDDTARVNALLGGQVLAVDALPPAQVPVVKGRNDLKVIDAKTGFIQPIVMRVDQAPFDDVRVRQAFRYMVDREQMVKTTYSGFAHVANDMWCPSDPCYPTDLPQRQQDIEKAKSLLKAAGRSDLSVELVTAPESPGLIGGAEVFASQAKKAGVNIQIKKLTPNEYDKNFTNWPFTQGYYGDKPFGVMFGMRAVPGAVFNDAHWSDSKTLGIYKSALKETDDAKRTDMFKDIQRLLFENGGDIVHSYRDSIDGYSAKLTGFVGDESTGWNLGQWRYREVSFVQ
jgi:peptide/nickel transport system substrate-binding protein